MSRIIKEEHKFQDIYYNLVYDGHSTNRPVVYFFHGFNCSKEMGPMDRDTELALLGYTVIVMDAYEHGKRTSNEFKALTNSKKQSMIVDIEIKTAQEAIKLYDHLLEKNYITSNFPAAAYGVSMGAAIAFYLTTIFSKVKAMVSIVGSPSFIDFYEYKQEVYDFPKDKVFYERLKKYEDLDPLIHINRFENKEVFMSVGLRDKIVPMIYAESLSKKINCTYKTYDLGHESNPKMLQDSYDFLKKHLV